MTSLQKIDWYPTPSFLMRTYVFNQLLPSSIKGRFLEIGIGEGGGLLALLDEKGLSGVGIDYSSGAVEKAKKRLESKLSSRVGIKVQDVLAVREKFGLLIAMEVLEHYKQDQELLKHFWTLLDSGGYLIFSVPADMNKWGEIDEIAGHARRYQKKDILQKLKKVGFREVVIRSYGFPLLNFSSNVRNFWLRKHAFKKKIDQGSRKERTRRSGGRFFKTPLRVLFNDFFIFPFKLIQSLFYKFDLGIGYMVRAKKPGC